MFPLKSYRRVSDMYLSARVVASALVCPSNRGKGLKAHVMCCTRFLFLYHLRGVGRKVSMQWRCWCLDQVACGKKPAKPAMECEHRATVRHRPRMEGEVQRISRAGEMKFDTPLTFCIQSPWCLSKVPGVLVD